MPGISVAVIVNVSKCLSSTPVAASLHVKSKILRHMLSYPSKPASE